MGDAVDEGRVDGVFSDVALDPQVVMLWRVPRQAAPLGLHLVSGLPGSDDHLADPAHGLGIRGDHGKGPQVVQDVLRGNGLAADARLGESDIFGNVRVQVMTHHQHVQVFIHSVDRVGTGGGGAGGQHIGFAANLDDVRRVAAAGALGVVGVDGAVLESGDGVFHKAGFVQGVGVERHLHIVPLRHTQAVVYGGGRGTPVLVEFQPHGARLDLLFKGRRLAGVALAEKAQIHGEGLRRL